ncbi:MULTISPECIES: Holliday junction branch migration protein RuvA [Jeotgalicoccus]|uniref:Holliday junction branch migration complex subunit RuvA n=1 Tax=Jeotgalicoccus nanhaiensis TaxID=568603 RepID=A0ABR9XWT6_9STAP|nr:Holliday junction branch migration protein RuvA [Jeotgalicoccus nanhaiensis]MBF0753201.1 Holliday junction branch migration protein RuvA [Jeotgalicoccus nanhaiensis]TFU62371.1 Holliday junction branch migration protein RuvA [Jeotgalicoccus nanhaiensis]
MYQYIKGKLTEVKPAGATVETGGIGYLLLVPNPFRLEGYINTDVTIFTELIVRDDAHTLYGFTSESEKSMFKSLLKVTGIGPKSALAILAAATPNEIINAIEREDNAFMQKFPGIGKKSASQIILDLKGKLKPDETADPAETAAAAADSVYVDEALLALEVLGYSKRELTRIEKKLAKENISSVDEAVKLGLKLLLN